MIGEASNGEGMSGRPASASMAGFSHVGVTVSNIEQAVEWFENVLGLELVSRQQQDNEYTRRLVGLEGAILEVAEFRLPGLAPEEPVATLELVEYVRPQGEFAEVRRTVPPMHVSFVVENIRSEYDRLIEHGVEFVSPPVEITEGVNKGGFACYFTGPDGITLEIFQPRPIGSPRDPDQSVGIGSEEQEGGRWH